MCTGNLTIHKDTMIVNKMFIFGMSIKFQTAIYNNSSLKVKSSLDSLFVHTQFVKFFFSLKILMLLIKNCSEKNTN